MTPLIAALILFAIVSIYLYEMMMDNRRKLKTLNRKVDIYNHQIWQEFRRIEQKEKDQLLLKPKQCCHPKDTPLYGPPKNDR